MRSVHKLWLSFTKNDWHGTALLMMMKVQQKLKQSSIQPSDIHTLHALEFVSYNKVQRVQNEKYVFIGHCTVMIWINLTVFLRSTETNPEQIGKSYYMLMLLLIKERIAILTIYFHKTCTRNFFCNCYFFFYMLDKNQNDILFRVSQYIIKCFHVSFK